MTAIAAETEAPDYLTWRDAHTALQSLGLEDADELLDAARTTGFYLAGHPQSIAGPLLLIVHKADDDTFSIGMDYRLSVA